MLLVVFAYRANIASLTVVDPSLLCYLSVCVSQISRHPETPVAKSSTAPRSEIVVATIVVELNTAKDTIAILYHVPFSAPLLATQVRPFMQA